MIVQRRSFIKGLVAVVAAPAVVKVGSLMQVAPTERLIIPSLPSNSLLTINMITRESIRLFTDSNAFLRNIDDQYREQFGADGAKIGTQLRIRLPSDYEYYRGEQWTAREIAAMKARQTQINAEHTIQASAPVAIAALGAAAVLAKNPTVSRRFWAK